MLAYTVPVTQTKSSEFQVNWTLIDRLIEYMKNRLYEIALPTDRHLVVAKYDLEEVSKKDIVRNRIIPDLNPSDEQSSDTLPS